MDAIERSGGNGWESGGTKSFASTIGEDAEGNIVIANDDREKSQRARLKRTSQAVRRGLIRYLLVAVDSSTCAAEKDFMPSRLQVCKSAVAKFIMEFYDQNPISSMALLLTRDRIAEQITDLSGNSKVHLQPLKDVEKCSGAASLQNTLVCAMATLKHVPDYGFRELLVVYNSLSSCDPGDINDTVQECKANKLRVSVICTAAEVRICRTIAEETGGIFAVATDAEHLSLLLMEHTIPPAELRSMAPTETEFVYMGFPKLTFDNAFTFAFEGKVSKLSRVNYQCPRCYTKTTDIPTECQVCSMQLNSSSRIARSHHHLFPVASFTEVRSDAKECKGVARCAGCLTTFKPDSMRMQCPHCTSIFCVNCDIFVHDSLHNCPGCGGAPQPCLPDEGVGQ